MALEDVHAFQVHLEATGIAWPALNQIVCALRFFYGVTLGHSTIPERIAEALAKSANFLLFGPPAEGKSNLAAAIGMRVPFTWTTGPVETL